VPTRETPPPIMQNVVVRLGANVEGDKLMGWSACSRSAPCDEIWPWSPHGVLDHIRNEHGQDHTNEPSENGDVCFVCAGACEKCPYDESSEGYGAGVYEEPCYHFLAVYMHGSEANHTQRHALDFGVRVADGQVVQNEHAMEGFGEELHLRLLVI
jgi:hypothetical protein